MLWAVFGTALGLAGGWGYQQFSAANAKFCVNCTDSPVPIIAGAVIGGLLGFLGRTD